MKPQVPVAGKETSKTALRYETKKSVSATHETVLNSLLKVHGLDCQCFLPCGLLPDVVLP